MVSGKIVTLEEKDVPTVRVDVEQEECETK